jgi:osmoprotectant transport system ATP-binding protein
VPARPIELEVSRLIRFDSVTKQYADGTVAVHELDLVAPSRQITVLVGPSGCGKTTSLRMINRMIEPTSGRILLDDRDTATFTPSDLRRGIGYVIQHAGLFPHRTVVDNVATVPLLLGQSRREARRHAMGLLERVGLATELAGRYPAQLSGGQQQRVGVARALAADPPVMLMDEPFSAVDPVVRAQLQDEFLRLQAELAKTIVFVTHDIDEAVKLGDQVAVMRVGGHLAQLASPAELLSRPKDAFVASFVGRDRGYRALQFEQAPPLATRPEPSVRLGTDLTSPEGRSALSAASDNWLLVVDDDHEPQGWLDLRTPPPGVVDQSAVHRGGTLATQGGSFRQALDAALSSPSGRGIVVDDDGRLLGSVTASQVVAAIEQRGIAARASEPGAAEPTGDPDRAVT